MNKLISTLLILSLSASIGNAVPVEEWNKTFGGIDFDRAMAVRQTYDGGYIFAGTTFLTEIRNRNAVWLVKTNSNGVEEWNKIFDKEIYGSYATSVRQTSDGGYIIAGYLLHSPSMGSMDILLIKTDSNGIEEWNKTFGGKINIDDQARSVQQTSDGGYILAGYTRSLGPDDSDALLIKTDANGIEEWNKTFSGPRYEGADSGQQTSDGGYILAGYIYSDKTGSYDSWLIKTDSNGIEEWNNTYGGTGTEEPFAGAKQTTDGGYILAGITSSYGVDQDAFLVKVNSHGVEEWNKIFGGSGPDLAWYVQQTYDGGYIFIGQKSGAMYGWLMKTDSNGIEEWNKTFEGGETFSGQQTSDRGYILAGMTFPWNVGAGDAWLIKIAKDIKPVTTIQLSGVSGNNDYFISDVQVTLAATDEGGHGIAKTEYSFDNINWDTYSSPFKITDEGIKTVYYRSIDNVDNIESTKTVSVKIDKSIPIVTASSDRLPDFNDWYNKSVTISFTGTDGISGIANCDSEIIYNGPDSTGTSVSGSCKDNAGNTGVGTYYFKYDSTEPTINIVVPVGNYVQNQVVMADYNCIDTISGVATCVGPVPSGNNIDTSYAGPKTFTVKAEDNAGNSNIITTNYDISASGYTFTGFFAPVDNLPILNIAKSGSAIPTKFSLNGDQGLNIFTEGYPASRRIDCTSGETDVIEATATAGQSGLSYDTTTDRYTYIWKTDKSWTGTCRQLTLKFDDGTEHSANFKFK